MNVLDDSDEDIFDATARPAVGTSSIDTLIECTEDETSCEMLQFLSTGESCFVHKTSSESFIPEHDQTTVQSMNSTDSSCNCDNSHSHTAVSAPSGSTVGADTSASTSICCDDASATTNSAVRTDCTNSCSTDHTHAPDVIGSCQTAVLRTVSINSSEPEDELLAELESEFSCKTPARNDCISLDCGSAVNGSLNSSADRLSDDDLPSAFVSLQRRQQALECRLQNTLEARRELETENARLECKLTASLEAVEAAKQDVESAKSQVGESHLCIF